jgi:hypothetical protein
VRRQAQPIVSRFPVQIAKSFRWSTRFVTADADGDNVPLAQPRREIKNFRRSLCSKMAYGIEDPQQ